MVELAASIVEAICLRCSVATPDIDTEKPLVYPLA